MVSLISKTSEVLLVYRVMVSLISKIYSEVLLVYRVMVSLISKTYPWGITSVQSYGIAHLKDFITSVQSYEVTRYY